MISQEYNLINRYFNRNRKIRQDVICGIGNECAILSVNKTRWIATSTDTLIEGVHFLPNINPADLGYKSLAINLSDLAAIGAKPAWLLLSLTMPKINETWMTSFSDSLFQELEYYGMQLVGGDITRGSLLSLTLTIHGTVPIGKIITRSGANIDDWIYVTGTLGDSAAGLAILQNRLDVIDISDKEYLLNRHLRPTPRLAIGYILRNLASASIDISDGIVADLFHILISSHCGALINVDNIPYSTALLRHNNYYTALNLALNGGEDYELCFTVPDVNCQAIDTALTKTGIKFTCIGQIIPWKYGIKFTSNNQLIDFHWSGYDHFKI